MYTPLGSVVDFKRLIVKERTFAERISVVVYGIRVPALPL
jgi:hypothetical protein